MKNEEVGMKNDESAGDGKVARQVPPQGADSQLHCYNVSSWRLAELFGDDGEPEPPQTKK